MTAFVCHVLNAETRCWHTHTHTHSHTHSLSLSYTHAIAHAQVPVLLGFFDPHGAATNFEQPAAAWLEDLRLCGFDTGVQKRVVFEYWWADCVLVDACSSRCGHRSAGERVGGAQQRSKM